MSYGFIFSCIDSLLFNQSVAVCLFFSLTSSSSQLPNAQCYPFQCVCMFVCLLGLSINTQYLSDIDRNNPVPSNIENVPVKQYLQSVLFVSGASHLLFPTCKQSLFKNKDKVHFIVTILSLFFLNVFLIETTTSSVSFKNIYIISQSTTQLFLDVWNYYLHD